MNRRRMVIAWKCAAAVVGLVCAPVVIATGVIEFTNDSPRVFAGVLAIAYGLAGLLASFATVFYVPTPESDSI